MKQRKAISKHFNPIEYIQCPEFSTTPAVFISGEVDVKIAGVVENSGHCIYSIGLKFFLNCFSLFHLVIYIYIYVLQKKKSFSYMHIYTLYIHNIYIYICYVNIM